MKLISNGGLKTILQKEGNKKTVEELPESINRAIKQKQPIIHYF